MHLLVSVLLAPGAALLASPGMKSSSSGDSSDHNAVRIRLANRADLIPLSGMMERAFAAPADGSRRTTFNSATSYGPLDSLNTRLRLALDVESRMTPWDWCRHAQVVAEDAQSGRILGFAEVWGEDAESLNNLTAKSPQPVVFNLCVAKEARRRGVAMGMLARCEEEAARWGDEALHLKVREDNMAACRLYEGAGYELIETRPVADIPSWQEQWKGGVVPLRVMRKRPLALPDSTEELGREVAPKGFDEFEVTYQSVKAYGDPDAMVWFWLLVLRNSKFLAPQYRDVGRLAAVLAAFGSYLLLVRILSTQPELYTAARHTFGLN